MPIPLIQAPGTGKTRKRIGRGHGSGHGKTSGKGQKGQKSRSGGTKNASFEGGRMPAYRNLPKLPGFKRTNQVRFYPVNVGSIKNIPEGGLVDFGFLALQGLLPRKPMPVKILGHGEVSVRATFRAHAFSEAARTKIEAAGGKCEEVGVEQPE
jgi:large subunit ribosomal protein L15